MKTKILLSIIFICSHILAEKKPSEILDLKRWKITMPYAAKDAKKPKPLEIFQPHLDTFVHPKHFHANETGDGVVFRAHCTSISTKKSKYPRAELREMEFVQEGESRAKTKASWGTNDGKVHSMIINQAITSLPPVKSHVVTAQIHHSKDDLMMVRLEGKKLFIERNKTGDIMLDPNYVLGTRFDLKIVAADKHVKVYYNSEL